MKNLLTIHLTLILGLCCANADWTSFRGSAGNGFANEPGLPTKLDGEKSIAWKVGLPGRGLSSPIVVGDSVFLTASSGPREERLHVFAINAKNGETIWERQFQATGRTVCHKKTCVAAPTAVSDGKVVVAQFSSNDVFCLDLAGNARPGCPATRLSARPSCQRRAQRLAFRRSCLHATWNVHSGTLPHGSFLSLRPPAQFCR